MSEIEEREIIKGVAYTYYNKDGIPNVRTVLIPELTDEYIKKIADEVVKRLNDKDEIVRCKDCKYWAEFTFNVPPFHYCGRLFQDGNTESIGFYMEADDFCSRGERKDD